MIKLKAICSVCNKEFDIGTGTYRVFTTQPEPLIVDFSIEKLIEPTPYIKDAATYFNENNTMICGKFCLMKHLSVGLYPDTSAQVESAITEELEPVTVEEA
jgi:hypothetical protein